MFQIIRDVVKRMKKATPQNYHRLGHDWAATVSAPEQPANHAIGDVSAQNPLFDIFEARKVGRGIWKWVHYFEAYHRHLSAFRGRSPVIVEVGVYSGGSLDMWQQYFGIGVTIHGVDIVEACHVYKSEAVTIHIGDQADPNFWIRLMQSGQLPRPDIVIDDGGHEFHQQKETFEALIDHLNPGGVYICEDVHGVNNHFFQYATGALSNLNAFDSCLTSPDDPERRLVVPTNALQQLVSSAHFYPFLIVLERSKMIVPELRAPKRGDQWEPHLG